MADPSRRHLLRMLDDADDALTLDDLAQRVGLHVNTVRGHLDILEDAGLVERTTVRRASPGRPRVAFRAVSPDRREPSAASYRLLADALAASIEATSDAPARAAHDAGREWGRAIVAQAKHAGDLGPDQAMAVVLGSLADLGFGPESRAIESGVEIRLHDCPFRSLARERTDVVCSVHAGLLTGILDAMDSDLVVEDLQPFVEPSLCVARITAWRGRPVRSRS